MIVVDTSALFAIYAREPDSDRLFECFSDAPQVLIGAPTAFELLLVVGKLYGVRGQREVTTLLEAPNVEIVPWTGELLPLAVEALERFGGRPARLNFGDCLVYALAKHHEAPLLYKGGDFVATDICSALD